MRAEGDMNTILRRSTLTFAFSLTLVMALAGCARDSGDIDPNFGGGASGGRTESTTAREPLPDIDVENLLFSPAAGLQKVYFDYDKYDLRDDALATLRANADKIKDAPGVIIQIEGHCDERGTQEYNLALGEKRALATRSHLINLGVSGDRLITISYGEEDPFDSGHTEGAWAKNRRCEFNRAM